MRGVVPARELLSHELSNARLVAAVEGINEYAFEVALLRPDDALVEQAKMILKPLILSVHCQPLIDCGRDGPADKWCQSVDLVQLPLEPEELHAVGERHDERHKLPRVQNRCPAYGPSPNRSFTHRGRGVGTGWCVPMSDQTEKRSGPIARLMSPIADACVAIATQGERRWLPHRCNAAAGDVAPRPAQGRWHRHTVDRFKASIAP